MSEPDRELGKRRAESRKRAWEAYVKAGGTMPPEEDDDPPTQDRIGFAATAPKGVKDD